MPLIILLILFSYQSFSCELAERKLAQLLETRRQALHHSLKDAGLSPHASPVEIRHVPLTQPHSGQQIIDPITHKAVMAREYVYEVSIPTGELYFDKQLNRQVRRFKKKIVIQEHSYGHNFDGEIVGPHFNVRPFTDTRHGEISGTLPHYLFETGHTGSMISAP